jgi:hypothetical protein
VQATDAFAAAQEAASRAGIRPGGQAREALAALAAQLSTLGEENRRLLQRAVTIQSRVIETIAGAVLPRSGSAMRYSASGQRAATRQAMAIALETRA